MDRHDRFGTLAGYYDILNYNADYKKTADYIEKVFYIYEKKSGIKPRLVLDLACGTGSLTLELYKRGYDMTGLDLSAEMLAVAASKKNAGDILWINQDMRAFELYGTVDAVVCCYDSLNYILNGEELKKCFGLVYNYLNPGGLFVFDINSKYKFERLYAGNNFVLENGHVFCSWQNHYDKKHKTCDFYLDLFVCGPEGSYQRYAESQREKYYGKKFIKKTLAEIGFGDFSIFYDFKTGAVPAAAKNHGKYGRICFAAVKI